MDRNPQDVEQRWESPSGAGADEKSGKGMNERNTKPPLEKG